MEKWAVIKIETLNGLRIGIAEQSCLCGEMEILSNNLNEMEAVKQSKQLSSKLNILQFDNNIDTY